MKKYFLKALYFCLVDNLLNIIINHNILEYIKNIPIEVFSINLISSFIISLIYIGVIKLVSLIVSKIIIYQSNNMIIYIAIVTSILTEFQMLFFLNVPSVLYYIITFLSFIITILLLFKLWEIRLEISLTLLFSLIIIKKTTLVTYEKNDILYNLFLNFFNIEVNIAQKGLIILLIISLFIGFLIFLRKQGLYSYESNKKSLQ